MKNTKKRKKINFKKLFIYYANILVMLAMTLCPTMDYSYKLSLVFYSAIWVFWTFVDITSEAHKLWYRKQ